MNFKMIIKTAFRNLLRNRKRSQLILIAVSGVSLAVMMMEGFAQFSYSGLQNRFSNSGIGQLQVGSTAAFNSAKPEDYRLPLSELNRVQSELQTRMLTSRLVRFSGLIGTETGSEVFQGQGVDFPNFVKLSGSLQYTPAFQALKSDEIVLGQALAKKLKLEVGGHVSLLVSMENGRTNMMDFTIASLIHTGSNELDAVTLFAPFDTIVSLEHLTKADLIMIHGGDLRRLPELRAEVAKIIPTSWSIRSWEDISSYYGSVKNLYSKILFMIKFVLGVTAILSVSNSLLLSIQERRGELGMLRAIGVSKPQLFGIFGTEGFILGASGAFLGAISALIISYLVKALGGIPMPPPPGSSEGYHLNFLLSFGSFLSVLIGAAVCGLLSAIYASRSQISIPVSQLLASLLLIISSGLGLSEAKASPSAQSILEKWDSLRVTQVGSYRLNARFDLLNEKQEIKDSVTYTVVVTPKGALAVSVSDPAGQRMAILTQNGGEGMWMQTEGMRKAIRVSPGQRLLGQASNADVVNIEWARDYTPVTFLKSVLTLVQKSENAAYCKIEIVWDEKKGIANSARYFACSGKLLKTAIFSYQKDAERNRLSTTLISDAFNPLNKTMVTTSATIPTELGSQYLNPEKFLQALKRLRL